MGEHTSSRESFERESRRATSDDGPATKKAEQHAHETGKLNPLVDPAGYGVIRRSLPRFTEKDGHFILNVGTPMPIETRIDTTGSMGNNIDICLRVMKNLFEPCEVALPGYDKQIATGIFGDVQDRFVLCRPQFEMEPEKIVKQLTLMVPERDGGDLPEDPHYGIFGAAYLTAAYINLIGLKGYDFTVSDAPARDYLDERELIRIFGSEVFEKVKENKFQMKKNDIPDTREVVNDLLKRAHAFFLQVDNNRETSTFWTKIFGPNRVVKLPRTEILPQVQATIIGLSEATLQLADVKDFLRKNNVSAGDAEIVAHSVANIPIGAQAALPNFKKRPQKGDVFKNKTDPWPMNEGESAGKKPIKPAKKSSGWL